MAVGHLTAKRAQLRLAIAAGLKQATTATDILFGSANNSSLSIEHIFAAFSAPTLVRMPKSEVMDMPLAKLLVSCSLVSSSSKLSIPCYACLIPA